MSKVWQDLAVAVGCRLEFERKCNRGGLLDESAAVRFAAEYLQAVWDGQIAVNEPHEDMPGKFVDLTARKLRSRNLGLALEAKWLKADGGTRGWLKEVAVDIFRLQHLTSNMAQDAERVVLVAGISSIVRSKLLDAKVHGGEKSTRGLDHILPRALSSEYSKFNIRHCHGEARKWLRLCQRKLDKTLKTDLPSTYDARLAGLYQTRPDGDAVEVLVWLTRRPKGWGSFSPVTEWSESDA